MNARLSAREASPVSLGDWIITLIVLAIPIVGIVMLFVWGFSGSTHPSKQNYCRAALILIAAAFVLWLVFFFTIGASLLHAAMGGATLRIRQRRACPARRRSVRVVIEVGRKPTLGFGRRPAFAFRVVLDLVFRELADHEILAVRMAEIPARYRGGGIHREAFRQFDAGVVGRIEQPEQRGLFSVVGAGGVARRRADAAPFLGDQVLVAEVLAGCEAPVLRADFAVHPFRERLGHAIRQRLQDDGRVVIVVLPETFEVFLDAEAGGDREAADPVLDTRFLRRDEICKAKIRAFDRLVGLLAQMVQHDFLFPRLRGKRPGGQMGGIA